jgi:CRISPR-associated protein Cmr4
MYQEQAAFFLYTVSPLHMGAGTALGAIDNPIQRERHTDHPTMAGSGLKGALRHDCKARCEDDRWLKTVFGPDTRESSEHAGAASFSDAALVLFPVRSARQCFVYAASPTTLARLQRLLVLAGCTEAAQWSIPQVATEKQCIVLDPELLTTGRDGKRLLLESFDFEPSEEGKGALATIARWLADHGLPDPERMPGLEYFRGRMARSLVVIHDDRFSHFVKYSTTVEAHVRIDDASGTADEGGLFYTENLPPESLLVSLAMTSRERGQGSATAATIIQELVAKVSGRLLQIGGDATVGRGQLVVAAWTNGHKEG